MELLEVLRRRAMVREFGPEPPTREQMKKLVYAATRAPNGGNMLSREIFVLDDPRYVKMLKSVTPSFIANAPVALVICTDMVKASDLMGAHGRDIVSLLDSGAAAENVALLAEEMGLGVSFVRSCTDSGTRKILGIPERYRIDIIVGVGHKSAKRAPAMKGSKPVVHHNDYGVPWNGSN